MVESVCLTDKQWREVDKIDGWLFREEADQLYRLCEGEWIEIGSWKGKSTIVLAQKHHGYAIDWFRGSPEHPEDTNTLAEYLMNIEPYKENITTWPLRMEDAVDKVPSEGIQLLFLDGAHEYEPTKLAFDLYAPKVEVGGWVILHDAWDEGGNTESTGPWPGVHQFMRELQQDARWVMYEAVVRNAAFQRVV